jgi:hypothetical protein
MTSAGNIRARNGGSQESDSKLSHAVQVAKITGTRHLDRGSGFET